MHTVNINFESVNCKITINLSVSATGQQSCSNDSKNFCCDTTAPKNDPRTILLVALLNIKDIITSEVGLNCVPILGSPCSTQNVCCTGNNFSGVIVIGCSPINIGG